MLDKARCMKGGLHDYTVQWVSFVEENVCEFENRFSWRNVRGFVTQFATAVERGKHASR